MGMLSLSSLSTRLRRSTRKRASNRAPRTDQIALSGSRSKWKSFVDHVTSTMPPILQKKNERDWLASHVELQVQLFQHTTQLLSEESSAPFSIWLSTDKRYECYCRARLQPQTTAITNVGMNLWCAFQLRKHKEQLDWLAWKGWIGLQIHVYCND